MKYAKRAREIMSQNPNIPVLDLLKNLEQEGKKEIAEWTKALKEATSLEGKLYARDRLRELKK